MSALRRALTSLALSAACFSGTLAAQERLTLQAVLAHAEQAHPDLDLARARHDVALAETQFANSLNDFRVTLDASLRGGRNALYDDGYRPDHFVRLNARKTLFDAGRQHATSEARARESEALALRLLDTRAQRRLTLMTRYFDLLLGEMRDVAETELMTVAFLNWDKARERQSVGQVAQWEVAELEARYLAALTRRNDVRRGLREKRTALAQAMNRPGMLLDELEDPRLTDNDRPLPEFDALLAHLRAHNPGLRAQQRLLASARHRLDSVRADHRPSLEFEAEAAAWKRDATARDDLRAGLNFVWPLWQGGGRDARLAREQARFHELQAQHDQLAMESELSLRETWEEIQWLRGVARRDAEMNERYRDFALDRARAEYEMELKTDIGNSMAETQVAKLNRRAVEYRLALAWSRLEALLGGAEALPTLKPSPANKETTP